MNPTLAQMKLALQSKQNALRTVGVQEAPDLRPKIGIQPQVGVNMEDTIPTGGVDLDYMQPGRQLAMQQQPPQPQPMMPQGMAPDQPSNILQMTPQGQAMSAMRPPQAPQQPQMKAAGMARGGSTQQMAAELMSKAARSAGMKAPVTAAKNLTTLQDFHTSLGDRVRQGAADMQDLMESMPFKYDKGHRVFTKSSAERRLPPYTILARRLAGNQIVYDTSGGGMKQVKDPQTGKAKRTPYEPGYLVRHEMGPDDWQEFVIPESAILGRVDRATGGSVNPVAMAKGGSAGSTDKRVLVKAEGSGNVKGIMVPRHMLEGSPNSGIEGMNEINKARAKVYGSEQRPPLTLNKIGSLHKQILEDHFSKPLEEQTKAEVEALNRLRQAKHIGKTANTLDESEKLDTVRHEHDEEGRTYIGYASKGVAGHALYTSGHGKDKKLHVINTCPGQTEGCGGGTDKEGVVDTKRGTCFAPNAESQYPAAAVRRASHAQAKHDPEMTKDWILAHTGSLRHAANVADKKNVRLLFRPNVVDETDVSSRHVLRHLNEQRKQEGKPPIIANSYGKTNELHDPENGYYVTHSNVGPKVKHGREISENIGRDRARVRNTILAADNKGDFKNEQGNKTPPKGSYLVTDVKRGSPLSKQMEKHITHAKYWTTGREQSELTPEEREEGPEGHYGPNGKPTTPEKAHYGHRTVNGLRFDYQKQHVLHPRLVQVGENTDGTPHMIPTDSRFKDTDFLPKNRFKSKNGKEAGHILMTTPTESTSNLGHHTPFTHNVSEAHIEHAKNNNGEYEIDRPEDQIKARGKEYAQPQPINLPKTMKLASGGSVGGRHEGFSHDDFHAFPEQNVVAQRHLALRRGDDENERVKIKKPVAIHRNLDTMRLALMKKAK